MNNLNIFEWKEGIWFCHDSSEYGGKTPFHILDQKWQVRVGGIL